MFNKRWKKVLFWTLSVIVVLGVAGLFAANYAVDKLMSSMADGFNVEADETTSNATQGEIVEPPVAAGDATAEPTASAAPGSKVEPTSNVEPTTAVSPSSTPASEGAGDKKADNDGQTAASTKNPTSASATDKGPAKNGYTAQVSTDKAKEIQESVTVKDKADVAAIVMGQLSLSDIKRLQELAKGGLTVEEKREARSIILSKVSEEQYNELSQVAKKYGVSQGKTRDEILASEEANAKEEQLKNEQQAQKEGSE
ncbi:RodZ family helix-turn-helix domain-containing protein [Paenibacillus riograndensis]|uniref:Putative membrane protein n=1 Tax=Paenibacillus riograndensis SBR5 TaxID=1073571 RepID=A0A0E3WIY6_9BACL|nr:hypothetical protein [Paenibacillus riograndensis]CQR57853.1 putative membrane protein [Paenibacillus riograndensis SBR5]